MGACDGSGAIFNEEEGHSRPCKCLRVKTRLKFFGERFYAVQLDKIEPRTDRQKRLLKILLEKPDMGVFIHGPGNRGKTHFLAGIYNYWDDRQAKVRYFDDAMLRDEIQNADLNGDFSFVRNLVKDYNHFFLDDPGKESMSNSYRAGLYQFFNEIYKHNKHVVIAANEPLNILGAKDYWGPHIARRAEDVCEVVEL